MHLVLEVQQGTEIILIPFLDHKDTHLYTLIIHPNATYEVKIDNQQVAAGDLEDDWAFLPPRKIKDPYAQKPRKWMNVCK